MHNNAGGCDFPARPGLSALDQKVLWSPSSDTAILLLTRRPDFLSPASASSAGPFAAGRDAPEGAYASFSEHDLQLLFLSGATPDDQLAALVPIDADIFDRIDALTRMAYAWSGRPSPRDTRMTADQRRRLRLKLRAADGHMNGATYREIAIAFYGDVRVDADPWKTSPLRDAVIAFVEGGLALINGGYLQLLRHRRRS
ncbi:hypothetical protein NT2_10_00120 [Caenibius tardaugens NBRC 16725]|jgi:hypothetical protein|uniref:T6SS Transcription factor RovC-like DNA binding domain-containing protein n=1 Tax=Caenibius tardaugens NBRC 16725 TaxID=1219035 RepID=U2YPH6_9SPHN|nr:DUF2285 domain-containing protein [Caenibius tardaugens]AZI35853.1 DUF2285 domain-containing protein [Caenibius tardaugens NBRC 16725]GAD50567.1 hypothetical protein NT2_10_00120 [Caenibius tardaugens NBRC 16725]